jgi:hypothetical protein
MPFMSDEVSSKHVSAFFILEGYDLARLDFRKELGGRRAAHNCSGWWVCGMTAGHNHT